MRENAFVGCLCGTGTRTPELCTTEVLDLTQVKVSTQGFRGLPSAIVLGGAGEGWVVTWTTSAMVTDSIAGLLETSASRAPAAPVDGEGELAQELFCFLISVRCAIVKDTGCWLAHNQEEGFARSVAEYRPPCSVTSASAVNLIVLHAALTRRHSTDGSKQHEGNLRPDWTHHLERYKQRAGKSLDSPKIMQSRDCRVVSAVAQQWCQKAPTGQHAFLAGALMSCCSLSFALTIVAWLGALHGVSWAK